jgi:outer membrane protein assembly factor BamB
MVFSNWVPAGSPTLADGLLIVVIGGRGFLGDFGSAAGYGGVCALDASSGSVKWCRHVEYPSEAAVAGGRVLVGWRAGGPEGSIDELQGRIQALDAQSGDVLWTHEGGDRFYAPSAWKNTVYAVSQSGADSASLVALDARNGTVRWERSLRGGWSWGLLATDGRTVTAGSFDHEANPDTGEWDITGSYAEAFKSTGAPLWAAAVGGDDFWGWNRVLANELVSSASPDVEDPAHGAAAALVLSAEQGSLLTTLPVHGSARWLVVANGMFLVSFESVDGTGLSAFGLPEPKRPSPAALLPDPGLQPPATGPPTEPVPTARPTATPVAEGARGAWVWWAAAAAGLALVALPVAGLVRRRRHGGAPRRPAPGAGAA